jgi:hypothetical protein
MSQFQNCTPEQIEAVIRAHNDRVRHGKVRLARPRHVSHQRHQHHQARTPRGMLNQGVLDALDRIQEERLHPQASSTPHKTLWTR